MIVSSGFVFCLFSQVWSNLLEEPLRQMANFGRNAAEVKFASGLNGFNGFVEWTPAFVDSGLIEELQQFGGFAGGDGGGTEAGEAGVGFGSEVGEDGLGDGSGFGPVLGACEDFGEEEFDRCGVG